MTVVLYVLDFDFNALDNKINGFNCISCGKRDQLYDATLLLCRTLISLQLILRFAIDDGWIKI